MPFARLLEALPGLSLRRTIFRMGRRLHHDSQVATTSKIVPNPSAFLLSIDPDSESKLDGAILVPCARMAAYNRFGNERHLPMARPNRYNLRDLGSGVHLSFFRIGSMLACEIKKNRI